ncbi:MAG: hypothetical protein JWR58_5802 [Pseudonocardia sp.]|nr:hypothetical protein [Pseudonocardia sp.]
MVVRAQAVDEPIDRLDVRVVAVRPLVGAVPGTPHLTRHDAQGERSACPGGIGHGVGDLQRGYSFRQELRSVRGRTRLVDQASALVEAERGKGADDELGRDA